MKPKTKALVLFSGGLDSMLAVKLLQNQGLAVTALTFKSAFWETTKAAISTKAVDTPHLVVNFSKTHLAVVKKPKYGYGQAANPCLDCHLLMLKSARKLLSKGYDFVASGEVLGQRPFSQHKKALFLLAEKSGLGDLLLRPLSAKLLPETRPEKLGWVNRSQLESIEGRGRSRQIKLAQQFGITNYPQPAGGCLLTDRIFGNKLKEMLQKWPHCSPDDIQLLRLGRHFWEGNSLVVLGRNQEENQKLERLVKKEDLLIIPKTPGPTALVRGPNASKTEPKATSLISQFSKKDSVPVLK